MPSAVLFENPFRERVRVASRREATIALAILLVVYQRLEAVIFPNAVKS